MFLHLQPRVLAGCQGVTAAILGVITPKPPALSCLAEEAGRNDRARREKGKVQGKKGNQIWPPLARNDRARDFGVTSFKMVAVTSCQDARCRYSQHDENKCMPIQSLACSGDGALDVRVEVVLIAPSLLKLNTETSSALMLRRPRYATTLVWISIDSSRQDQSIACIKTLVWRDYGEISAYTCQKAKSKYRNRIRLERASQKQSSDVPKTPYDRKINFKASERFNVNVFKQNKRPCPQHSHAQFFFFENCMSDSKATSADRGVCPADVNKPDERADRRRHTPPSNHRRPTNRRDGCPRPTAADGPVPSYTTPRFMTLAARNLIFQRGFSPSTAIRERVAEIFGFEAQKQVSDKKGDTNTVIKSAIASTRKCLN
ncbi:hypothetical protein PR048_002696 [Dryococelus australis]|uniref:Uncharacterized protein n=1 Tax=Dryococelus australis TaxID=614101 RepID=A0ABQ9IKX0_9NEOP|nr:hypothetical protein PR048_002696 [Dryococelus australis]